MIKKYLPYILFLIIISVLFVTNYTVGTWLSGWDNLHPEFDFTLNIKRSIQAVWQEYQSLGLLGGMGHAADLPRQIFLWIASSIIPLHLLRYFYHFLMLFVGSIGIYTLLKFIILSKYNEKVSTLGAFLGGVFYIFNLGTIQYFFVPFEPYSTFWGLFPWEIFALLLFYKNSTKRNLLILVLANVIAIPQGYVQTIFLVYVLCVAIFMFSEGIISKNKFQITKSAKVLLLIFCINAFWLLPNIYFVFKNISVTQNAMQNQMATEKFFQMNKNHGTIADFPVLKEFYYDFLDSNKDNQTDYMMKVWRNYFSSPIIMLIGYFLFFITLYGLIQKNRFRVFFLCLFFLSAVIFLSNTIIINTINNLLRSLPLINQIFRNPFTKFIVPTIFIFSIGFSIGATKLMQYVDKRRGSPTLFIFLPFLLLLFIYTFPVWKGQFISPQMRVTIPQDYFKTFNYFKTQDKTARIMNLPQGSYWGWEVYQWGARGSGFLWYGIEQPILDRAFDVWSAESENYYWQLNYALQKRDKNLFNSVIDKYQIQFILYDESFSPSDNFNSKKVILKQKDMLDYNPKVTLVKQFGSVFIYKTHPSIQPNLNIDVLHTVPNVKETEKFMNFDSTFKNVGFYTSDKSYEFFNPFGSLFTNRFQNEMTSQIENSKSKFILTSILPKGNFTLNLPSYSESEDYFNVSMYAKKTNNNLVIKLVEDKPKVKISNHYIQYPPQSKEYSINVDQSAEFPLYMRINNKDTFIINSVNDTYKYIGATLLSHSQNSNSITLYSSKNSIRQELDTNNFLKPTICGIQKGKTELSSKILNNALILKSKNTAICSIYGQNIIAKPNSLIEVSMDYKSSSDEYPQFCFYSKERNECLNNKDTITTGFSNSGNKLYETFQQQGSTTDQNYFNVILEAINDEDKDKEKSILYKNITVKYYPLIASISVDNLIDEDLHIRFSNTSPMPLSIEIPKNQNSFSYIKPISRNIYKKNPLNYDMITSQISSIEEKNNDKKYLRTSAENTSSSILIRKYDLMSGISYIVDIRTKNVEGFPFTINAFSNKDSRNYLYSYLPKNSSFNSSYYILPPLYEFDQGLNILLSSTSFNNHPSINDFQDVSIYPIPYNFVSGLTIQGIDNLNRATFTIPQVTKKNIYKYTISPKGDKGTLFLSQAFDSGWKAYAIKNPNIITSAIPFIFGKSLQHVEVNGWANGWKLNDLNMNGEIVIVYWPQYLEYVGFILLLVPIVALFKKRG